MGLVRKILLVLAAILFVGAGLNHFRELAFYERIVPPFLPGAAGLVVISGVAEIAGGIGLLIPWLRRAAGYGLIALLVAVFPANVYMAVEPERFAEFPQWGLWLRLPVQVVLIAWVWFVALRRSASSAGGSAATA